MESIYKYLEFKIYLTDSFTELKAKNPKFSYRKFARLCGASSPSFLQLVQSDSLRLNDQLVQNISKGLKLKKREARYFKLLVDFHQAGSLHEKEKLYNSIARLRARILSIKTTDTQYKYYSKWYHSALRGVIGYTRFNPDTDSFNKLGQQLNPTVNPRLVKSSLKLLEGLGFIKRNSDGNYRQNTAHVTTGAGPVSLQIMKYQKESGLMAGEALFKQDPRNIEFSTLTCNVSEKGFKKIKEKLIQTRKEIIQLVHEDSKEDRVYQMNMQLFPSTKLKKNK